MTDTIDFPIETTPDRPNRRAIRFKILDTLADLPDGPGLYVLMGAKPGEIARPLAFGYLDSSLSRHLPSQPEFTAALRDDFAFVAIADLVPGFDSARLAEHLGRTHKAPINIMRSALREIDSARLAVAPQYLTPLAAE